MPFGTGPAPVAVWFGLTQKNRLIRLTRSGNCSLNKQNIRSGVMLLTVCSLKEFDSSLFKKMNFINESRLEVSDLDFH